jgi:hypothetical protein
MGIFIYALVLIFFMIPLSIRAYLSLKHGRSPLPHFQNNIVLGRIRTRRSLGVLSPILFWIFHTAYVIVALLGDAWIAALAAVAYMVASSMLSKQIRAKGMHGLSPKASPRDPGA